MPPKGKAVLSDSDHLIFLCCCVRSLAEAPKPDFQKVADDLGIVSAAAAAKRYQRLMKNLEAGFKGAGALPVIPSKAGLEPYEATPSTKGGKKRKVRTEEEEEEEEVEDENPTPSKRKTRSKPRVSYRESSDDEEANNAEDAKVEGDGEVINEVTSEQDEL